MLQARLVSYPDAHRHRMGVNYDALPVNRAVCPVHNYHRDGHLRFDDNGGVGPNYELNSFGGPVEDKQYTERPMPIEGDAARYNHREGNGNCQQPGDLPPVPPAQNSGSSTSPIGAPPGYPAPPSAS
jgi:catalase